MKRDFTSGRISVVSNMSKLSASSFFMQENMTTGRAAIFYMGISGYQSLVNPSFCQIAADCIDHDCCNPMGLVKVQDGSE